VYQGDVGEQATSGAGVATLTKPDISTIADEVVEQIRNDAEFAARVAEQLGLPGGSVLRTVEELLANDEDFAVEFKSTARWDMVEAKPNKAMEDAVVKTVAGFLNSDGGTLLIGVDNAGVVLGLELDYARVKPQNGDGFVNWLTTHLINALGHTPVTRVIVHDGNEICRIDVAGAAAPVFAKTSKNPQVFYVRFNNSTRALPENEIEAYIAARWPT
jgi:type I restriction enzyme R subunit